MTTAALVEDLDLARAEHAAAEIELNQLRERRSDLADELDTLAEKRQRAKRPSPEFTAANADYHEAEDRLELLDNDIKQAAWHVAELVEHMQRLELEQAQRVETERKQRDLERQRANNDRIARAAGELRDALLAQDDSDDWLASLRRVANILHSPHRLSVQLFGTVASDGGAGRNPLPGEVLP